MRTIGFQFRKYTLECASGRTESWQLKHKKCDAFRDALALKMHHISLKMLLQC